jgi:uncharacterized protein YecE (DUF72 family)
MKIYTGTSGYGYKPWKGRFYPKDLPEKDMLKYYSSQFNSVEINNTFYSMPSAAILQSWKTEVPAGFRFFIKAPSKITHVKRLKNCEDELKYFIDLSLTIEKSFSGFLFQLPPNYKKNMEVFENFISLIPPKIKAAFEFRHESWQEQEVYNCLKKRNFALCMADTDELPVKNIVATASWGYLRLRKEDYSEMEIKAWYNKITKQEWKEVFIYFKHEDKANGTRFAAKLRDLNKALKK